MWCLVHRILFKYLERNILVDATVFWVNHEGIRLSETSQTPKD